MPHKMHTSKRAGTHHADIYAAEITKASSNIGPLPPMSSKHDLSIDSDDGIESHRSTKRRKINSNKGLDHHDPPSSDHPETTAIETIAHTGIAPDTSSQDLPAEVRHLSSKYDFTMMSILSSAKINDKVEKLLLRIEKFSYSDPKSKPGVVVLHAKSEVASKMISIVQIARQQIERDHGKWWQYSKLHGVLVPLKAKAVKRKGNGRTLLEWEKERVDGELQGREEVGGETRLASKEAQHDHEAVNGDEDMEEEFESMPTPKEANQGAQQSRNSSGTKIRATPVMTIYFARVPVPGLKELYGYVLGYFLDASTNTDDREQTNFPGVV